MSTSNPATHAAAVPDFAPSLPGQADPGVLPDFGAMERLVTELFSALPGGGTSNPADANGISGSGLQAGSGLPPVLAPAFVPSLAVPSSVRGDPHRAAAYILAAAYAMPDESALRELLANISNGVPLSLASAQSAPAQPGSAASPLNAPALDVPAALASEAELSQGSALPVAIDPFQLDPLSAIAGISQFGVPASRAGAGSPLTGPAIARPDAPPGSKYYFVDAARAPVRGTPAVPGSADGAAGFGPAVPPLDVLAIRRDFPILQERVNGLPLIWFDNAATTQKPRAVIDRLTRFYEHENSNIHRAAHELAARSTDAYEGAREKVRGFLNAASANEIVFVRGTTEGINLVAQSWGRANIGEGDEIVVSHLEHHANIVPWQQLCAEKGARLRVAPVDECGQILLDEYGKLLGSKTRLVAFTQVSNALGTVTPARQMVAMAHAAGAKVLVDGAQSVSHMPVNVQDLDSDWFVFSGHKVFGPTGIGVMHGKEALLNATPPWQGGGNMIRDVSFEQTEYQAAPTRFEAGTGNIADAVGLGAAIDYVGSIGIARIAEYEHYLLRYATDLITQIPGLRLIGTAADKASVLSFVIEGFEAEDVGKALNQEGIAVRAGHHCAQPILRRFGLEATIRASLAFYNTCAEVDALIAALRRMSHARPMVVP